MIRTWAVGALICGCLAAGGCLGGTPAEGPPDAESPKVTVRLNDGSVLVGKLLTRELRLVTPFGALTLPIAQVFRVDFGARPTPEDLVAARAAIAKLGSTDFAERDGAFQALAEAGAKALEPLREAAAAATDMEVKQRISTLQSALVRGNAATLQDRIVARGLRASGALALDRLEFETRFGKLSVLAREIERLEFDILKKACVENFEKGAPAWEGESNGETRWHVSRKRAGEGRYALRCSLPEADRYGDAALASIASPRIDIGTLERPTLRYRYLALIENGADQFHVEVSINAGESWTRVQSHGAASDWTVQRISLDAHRSAQFRIRFVFQSDESENQEGVYVDEVSIGEGLDEEP